MFQGQLMADLLVVGGGMAGLAAAAAAASAGARVAGLEKRGTLGGSAAMSAGIVRTAPGFQTLRQGGPGRDAGLGQALVRGVRHRPGMIRSPVGVRQASRGGGGGVGWGAGGRGPGGAAGGAAATATWSRGRSPGCARTNT